MTLDLFTVTVMTAIVASVASITYILETIFRRDAGPGRLWAVAFFCGLSTTIAYMAWSSGVGGFVSVAVGNSLFVLVPGFVWLGARRFNDRPIGWSLVLVVVFALASFAAALIQADDWGSWGGWTTMAACLVALFVAAAVEALRAPLGHIRSGWALAAVLLFAALFSAVRLVLFLAAGPASPLFSRWFGTISANIVTVVLTVVAAIVTSVLRSHRSAEQRYEWLTERGVASDGVMLARTFVAASADIIERASWRSEGVVIVVIRVEGLAEIRTAFGQEAADDISGACRQAVRRYAPASAIVGEDDEHRLAVAALAPTAADARRLGAMIYRGCMEELARADSGLFPFVGVGVAFTGDVGYDVGALLRGARAAARRAAATPGASVLVDAPAASS